MIIELDINGARLIISGDNLTVNLSQDESAVEACAVERTLEGADGLPALRMWLKAQHGRQKMLAAALNITTAAIPQWREVPADKLIMVERVTSINRQVLRPDLFEGMTA